jgi:hypothetical protein
MARESKLGLPHLQNAKVDDVPPTVYDLRGYDHRIFTIYSSKPKHQRFINGANGKVAPGAYGSEQRHDLGLCFATFLTRKRCEMGVACPWRHHPLSNAERAWVVEYGKSKGKDFIGYMDRWWAFPEVSHIMLHLFWTCLTSMRCRFRVLLCMASAMIARGRAHDLKIIGEREH